VFLEKGKEGAGGTPGAPGEGLSAKAFSGNANGCTEGGIEIEHTTTHAKTYVCNGVKGKEGSAGNEGKQGPQGEPGTDGARGEKGSNGAAGAQGPAGPAGKEGPAGKVQVVTCKKSGKKQKCTTKTVSGTVKFTTSVARATLSRRGVVYAAGTARAGAHGSMSLRLVSVRKLRPAHYTLTLISGSGRQEAIRNESFTLR
jgi:hypothetical protein